MIRARDARLALTAAALAAAASASAARAAPVGQVCPTFQQAGITYRSETLGSGWTCKSAKRWIVKLSADRVGVVSRNVPLKNGPRGYHCFADPLSRKGRATAGSCIKGTIAFPGSGFAWTGG